MKCFSIRTSSIFQHFVLLSTLSELNDLSSYKQSRHFKYLFYADYQTIKLALLFIFYCWNFPSFNLIICYLFLFVSLSCAIKHSVNCDSRQCSSDYKWKWNRRPQSSVLKLHITRLWFWHHSWTKSMFHKNYTTSCFSSSSPFISFPFSCASLEIVEFGTEYENERKMYSLVSDLFIIFASRRQQSDEIFFPSTHSLESSHTNISCCCMVFSKNKI